MSEGEQNEAPATKARSGGGGALGMVLAILLVLVGSLGFIGWKLWNEFQAMELASSADAAGLRTSQRELQSQVQELQAQLAAQVTVAESLEDIRREVRQFNDRLQQVERGMETMRQATRGGDLARARAEARFLVQMASDELQLRGNVDNALQALNAADARLRDSGDPSVAAIRAQLAEDRLALESLPDIDITGTSLSLASLANAVGGLPLRQAGEPVRDEEPGLPADASTWQRFKAATGRLFGNLVTVRREEDPRPFIAPGQEYFLVQNLELKLESARLSLLMRDMDNFHATTAAAGQWIDRYFDTGDDAVAATRQQLAEMNALDLPTQLPDLSTSLRLLDAESEGQ